MLSKMDDSEGKNRIHSAFTVVMPEKSSALNKRQDQPEHHHHHHHNQQQQQQQHHHPEHNHHTHHLAYHPYQEHHFVSTNNSNNCNNYRYTHENLQPPTVTVNSAVIQKDDQRRRYNAACEIFQTVPHYNNPMEGLSAEHRDLVADLRAYGNKNRSSNTSPQYAAHDFNLLRWALAYVGDGDAARKKYRRHLRIRDILKLDAMRDDDTSGYDTTALDALADHYAPMTICGEVADYHTDSGSETPSGLLSHSIATTSPLANHVLLVERSGAFNLPTIMRSIRANAFMLNRFRLMERVLDAVNAAERRTGRLSGAVLLIDLNGLTFHSGLIGFISGPYRIMWGTLIEQYPHLIRRIFVINTPTFMNVLWNACSTFIPAEYRKRIHLLNTDWRDSLAALHLPVDSLPLEYGGRRNIDVPTPLRHFKAVPLEALTTTAATINVESEMESLVLPAGGCVIHTYYLNRGELLEFCMQHDTELTMNIFYTPMQRVPKSYADAVGAADEFEEVYAGCERPGLPTVDAWKWHVPSTGFYHMIFGNEKAWIMSVPMHFAVFQCRANGAVPVKLCPIPGAGNRPHAG